MNVGHVWPVFERPLESHFRFRGPSLRGEHAAEIAVRCEQIITSLTGK